MTDKELKKLAKENNFEPTYELIQFARLAIMKTRINELALFAENTRAAIKKERERCAKIALTGTGEPVQVATLKILKKERERIAAGIFEVEK